jgi:predicted transcriptional regulator
MTLSEVSSMLSCEVFCGEKEMNTIIEYGCASDLMSDVLAFSRSGAMLLTGLVNTQTIHTAFIAELKAVVFVRGKRPDKDLITLASEKKIPLLGTQFSMYEACGILYKNGLVPTMESITAKSSNG